MKLNIISAIITSNLNIIVYCASFVWTSRCLETFHINHSGTWRLRHRAHWPTRALAVCVLSSTNSCRTPIHRGDGVRARCESFRNGMSNLILFARRSAPTPLENFPGRYEFSRSPVCEYMHGIFYVRNFCENSIEINWLNTTNVLCIYIRNI